MVPGQDTQAARVDGQATGESELHAEVGYLQIVAIGICLPEPSRFGQIAPLIVQGFI